MTITIVASVASNGVIGKQGGQPLYIKADLKRFRELTTGHPVIMGRKTFEAIVAKLGKPLPNRTNIVVTSQAGFDAKGGIACSSIEDAVRKAGALDSQVFIVGGAQVYAQSIGLADRLELTQIHKELEGDAYFPSFDKSKWRELSRLANEEDGVKFDFVTYEKA